MKPVKNFIFAMVLISVMAVSTTAGIQDTAGYVGPPPPPPQQMATISDDTTSGSNSEQANGSMTEVSDYLFLETLAALLSVY